MIMTEDQFTPPPIDETNQNKQPSTENAQHEVAQGGLTEEEEQVIDDGEITNNDGSVVETLDTAFHNKPGYIAEHSPAGSNRAGYYEARSDGKSDSDEELEYLKSQSGNNANSE